MDQHLFRVGQMVTIGTDSGPGSCKAARQYKILCLLPMAGGGRAYRVKTVMEKEARVVMEADCRVARAAMFTTVAQPTG